MLVKFIYPITDVRPFLDDPTHHIKVPALATPNLTNFVRDFGSFKVKRKKWEGLPEEYFCTAYHSLRIPGLKKLAIPAGDKTLYPNLLVRRLYHSWSNDYEFFFYWVEVTFGLVDPTNPDAGLQMDEKGLIEALNQLVQIQANVPVFEENKANGKEPKKKKFKPYNLGNAGPGLANLFLHSSSRYRAHANLQKWWVRSGLPMVVVHCREDDLINRPRQFHPIHKTGLPEIYLDYCRLPFRRLFLHTWLLRNQGTNPIFEVGAHHRLQQRLSQLFTEYEHYKQIVEAIAYEQLKCPAFTEKKDRLTRYLNRSVDLLTRPKYNGIKQEEILAQFAPGYRDFLTKNELDRFIQQLEDARINILRKAVNFTVTGGKQSVPLDHHGRGLIDPKRGGAASLDTISNSSLKEELERLRIRIAKGELALAFDTLQSLINRANALEGEARDELLLLCYRHSHLEKEKRDGVLSEGDSIKAYNRLAKDFLNSIRVIVPNLSMTSC